MDESSLRHAILTAERIKRDRHAGVFGEMLDWLCPLLERMARGEDFSLREITHVVGEIRCRVAGIAQQQPNQNRERES